VTKNIENSVPDSHHLDEQLVLFDEQPVPQVLREKVARYAVAPVERALLAHGRLFTGTPRPKGFPRYRAPKQCYRNAGLIATYDGWQWKPKRGYRYVEGFAYHPGSDFLFQHAWVTLDGEHAIDPTLSFDSKRLYFGLEIPTEVLGAALNESKQTRLLDFEMVPSLRSYLDGLSGKVAA
jgi:hypothetical protein